MTESEWKIFRQVREVALDRYCERVLAEVTRVASDAGQTHHERYLAVYRLIGQRDEELANAFNDPRRSTAVQQLLLLRSLDLLTEEEFARFRQETRDSLEEIRRGLRE
jgi:hypothetical protein